jgi:subtilase family serine protease
MHTPKKFYVVLFLNTLAGLVLSAMHPAAAMNVSGDVVGFHAREEHGIGGMEMRPQSNRENPEDPGLRAHTHLRVIIPADPDKQAGSASNFNFGANLNTPSSVACLYGLAAQPARQPAGCDPQYTTANPAGGGGAIAIVDAYDDPTAAEDLAVFCQSFDLAGAFFQVVYAGGAAPYYVSGPKPPSGVANGWALEEALDIEWAHAMAPNAKIYLVEAQSNSFNDLFTAVVAAESLVANNGGGEVSMSWGSSEFNGETQYDAYFAPGHSPSNVVFVAASGDQANLVEYPAASPYVISSGGTTINRNSAGAFISETAWSESAGGLSAYEQRPAFQNLSSVRQTVGSQRGVPDISLIADPNSGVAVYLDGGWWAVGGTSVAAPANAGIMNVADYARHNFPGTSGELSRLYGDDGQAADFRSITSGSCGIDSAKNGYDLCTGWGSLYSYNGK